MCCNFDTYPLDRDRYRLIALDMDGTLLRRDKSISARTSRVLQALQEQGMHLVIETGRCPSGVVRYADTIGLDLSRTYAVCYNGSGVFTLGDCHELSAVTTPGAVVRHAAEIIHRHGLDLHAYSQDRALLIENDNPYSAKEIFNSRSPWVKVDFAALPDDEPIYKAIAVGDPRLLDELRPMVEADPLITSHMAVMRSDPHFLEFIAGKSTKGSGLLQLCSVLGIEPAQSIAFGDAENDAMMLHEAGLAVAMGNAIPELKAAADIVTLSCDEDGVAVVLERLLK